MWNYRLIRVGSQVGWEKSTTNQCSTDPGSDNRRTDLNGSWLYQKSELRPRSRNLSSKKNQVKLLSVRYPVTPPSPWVCHVNPRTHPQSFRSLPIFYCPTPVHMECFQKYWSASRKINCFHRHPFNFTIPVRFPTGNKKGENRGVKMSHWNYDEIKKVIELWRKILLVTLNFDTRRVSILVLGPISKSFHKNWNKFELRLHNFIPILMETFPGPKSNSINLWNWTSLISLWIFQTSTFVCKLENVWITYQFFNGIASRPCLRNGRTEYALTVSPFCAAHANSHVSSYLFTFRCLLGHVCETCGPTVVDVSHEVSWNCSCTKILVFLSMKLELLCPLLFVSPFSGEKDFFFFPLSIVQTLRGNQKSRPAFCTCTSLFSWNKKFHNDNCRYGIFYSRKEPKTKIETHLL